MKFAEHSYPCSFSLFFLSHAFPGFMVTGICLLFACGAGDVGGKFLICGTCALIWTVGLNGKWQQEEDACRDWVYARMLYHQGNYTAANEAYHKLYPQLDERGILIRIWTQLI